jgi:predicted unusual protein kinase regulating ubiquinone biosynthesis (AarF/ABC1/UbiB family)
MVEGKPRGGLATSSLRRTARLASLPASYAGRSAWGVGKRIGGKPAEVVATELQRRTAEQLFRVLGELKGGAMKLGQALSVFETALPEEIAAPYRLALSGLQHAAPPMPALLTHSRLKAELGPTWRDVLVDFQDKPAASASIGQVHRAVFVAADGTRTDAAVKVQYPGVAKALSNDLRQLARLARLFAVFSKTIDVRALALELADRVMEELDYVREGRNTEIFRLAFADEPLIAVPRVLLATPTVLVTEWMSGIALTEVIQDPAGRDLDAIGALLVRAIYAGPYKAGLMHTDPHPGNFLVRDDGVLVVLDFGATQPMPDGIPAVFGSGPAHALLGDGPRAAQSLKDAGLLAQDAVVDCDQLLEYLQPLSSVFAEPTFHVTRQWMRENALVLADPRNSSLAVAKGMRLAPEHVLIYRACMGLMGVLAQMDATVPLQGEQMLWSPGFKDVMLGDVAA